MRKYIGLLLFFIVAFFISHAGYKRIGYAEMDTTAEINRYIEMLTSGNIIQRTDAAKRISRSGLTDPKLFNIIEEQLLKGYQSNLMNKDHVDEMAWLCKALASSGIADYKETLEKVTNTALNPKLKKYAKQSLRLVDEYAERNAILADNKHVEAGLSPEVAKYINMLKSNKISLKKDAAKMIFRSNLTDQKLFEVVNEELLKGYQLKIRDRNHVDAMAWLCKALGSSGMSKYKVTLEKIYKTSRSKVLIKYAKQGLDMLP